MKNFLLILIFISFSLIFADAIYLKNGTKIDGEIVGIADDSIMIQPNNLETKLVKVGTKDIARIEREKEGRAFVKSAPFGILAAEFGGGLVGGYTGISIGIWSGIGLAYLFGARMDTSLSVYPYPPNEDNLSITFLALTFGAIGCTFGSAVGTYLVGSAFHQNGRFGPTLIGTLIGIPCLFIGAPFGSVIGYNKSRPKIQEQSFLYEHFDLPSFSFRTEKTKENKITPVYDLRLVNVRF